MDITLRPRPLSLCIHQCVCVCQKTSSSFSSSSSSSCAYTHRAKHPLLDSHVNDRLSQCQKASSFSVVFSPPSFISSYRVEMGSSSHFFSSFLPSFLVCCCVVVVVVVGGGGTHYSDRQVASELCVLYRIAERRLCNGELKLRSFPQGLCHSLSRRQR